MVKSTNDAEIPATTATIQTPPSYQEAVQRARKFLESWMAGNGHGLTAGKNLADARDWQAMNSEVLGAAMLRKKPGDLVAWAKADREGWDALRLGVASALERGDEIPPEAAKWLALNLRGAIERPLGNPGTHDAEGLHIAIYMAVHMLVQSGMDASRNDASASTSACDAVADVMAEIGLKPATFGGVKKVWLKRKKQTKPGIPRT
ncbi:hypothetical protein [Tritonibacter mobilis]|uniref:hypothetical protein n=1 Tax=Tritonibacter mobilis TaxID=379347 RepID=UPI0014041C9E|nr:hypothetical protein [Tritonibacter mobilis]NHM17657.1 hypothetical protein [Tritonibacter mobilis]NHM21843.1 hypothetical protein [Tritonibacter mobilis]